MYPDSMRTRADLVRFVELLPITRERREVVLLELEDHLFAEMAERESAGATREDAEAAAVARLGLADLRRALVQSNAGFAPTGVLESTWMGLRAGASFASTLIAISLAVGVAELFYFRFSGGQHWPWFQSLVYSGIAAPMVLHFVLLRPERFARRLGRIEDPAVFGILVAVSALVSAIPIEFGPAIARAVEAVTGLWPDLTDPVFGMIFLAMWLAHVLWLALARAFARREWTLRESA